MSEVELPYNGWRPRPYQKKLWGYLQRGGTRAIEVAHRRWGRTIYVSIGQLEHVTGELETCGVYCRICRPYVELSTMSRVQSFPPIASKTSKVLILGSMPSEASLKTGQYYAHPQNAFWRIMEKLFGAGPSLPYEERVRVLDSARVGLWDSLQACIRPGSLDASITDEVANDFPSFFDTHPNITHVFFNGSKAETLFRRHCFPALANARQIFARLPSTSPAHAAMAFEAKMQAWSVVRKVLP